MKGKSNSGSISNKVNTAVIPVDVGRLSEGLALTFRGVTKVFESIGVETLPGFGVAEADGASEAEKPVGTPEPEAAVPTPEPEKEEAGEAKEQDKEETNAEAKKGDAKKDKPKEEPGKESGLTIDDITRVAAQKIKASKANTDRIGALVKTYGVSNLKELKPEKFEDFLTDLSQI